MAANSTHADYDAKTAEWSRARDVLGGEDAVVRMSGVLGCARGCVEFGSAESRKLWGLRRGIRLGWNAGDPLKLGLESLSSRVKMVAGAGFEPATFRL